MKDWTENKTLLWGYALAGQLWETAKVAPIALAFLGALYGVTIVVGA